MLHLNCFLIMNLMSGWRNEDVLSALSYLFFVDHITVFNHKQSRNKSKFAKWRAVVCTLAPKFIPQNNSKLIVASERYIQLYVYVVIVVKVWELNFVIKVQSEVANASWELGARLVNSEGDRNSSGTQTSGLSPSDGHHNKRAEGKILPCRLPSSPIVKHTAQVDLPEIPRGSWKPQTHPIWRWYALHLDGRCRWLKAKMRRLALTLEN